MSKRAKEASLKAWPKRKDGRLRHYTCTDDDIRKLYAQGYRKAEKDIWDKIEKYLSEQAPGDYATAGFILKNFEYFKQQIMEDEQ